MLLYECDVINIPFEGQESQRFADRLAGRAHSETPSNNIQPRGQRGMVPDVNITSRHLNWSRPYRIDSDQ